MVLSDSGDVFYTSENVFKYLGYTQVIEFCILLPSIQAYFIVHRVESIIL